MRLIDRFMPAYQFSETHFRRVAAPPASVLAAAIAYRAEEDRLFRIMIGLRELPARLLNSRVARREAFGLHRFTLLARTEGEVVFGLIGRFWRPDFGLVPIADDAAFLGDAAGDAAKLTVTFWTRPEPDGRTRLVTETRVFCPSRSTHLKFTPYWYGIRPVSGLLRRRMLATIARACEQSRS